MAEFTLIIGNKNYSSWSMRPWLVLKQAGVEFDEVLIPFFQPTTNQKIQQHSPSGKVPVLRHGSLLIWESLAICEYIAELFPECHLLPQDQQARAVARAVSAEMHAGFALLRQHLPMNCASRIPEQEITAEVQADIDRIQTIWNTCRQQFGDGGGFLFGQNFTIADAMFAPVASRFVTYGVPLDPVSQVYVETLWSFPVVQEWLTAAEAEIKQS